MVCRPLFVVLLVVLLIGSSCKQDPPPQASGKPAARAVPPVRADPHAGAPPAATAAKPPPPSTTARQQPRRLDHDQKAAYQAYRIALSRGRKLTRNKDYAGAVSAFDRALKQIKDDPRAHAERGYARLLARDYKGALADLDRGRRGATKPRLLAAIWYNLGLAQEGSGHKELARTAFARSLQLRPTRAARNKLAGKAVCSSKVDRSPTRGAVHDGWLALHRAAVAAWIKEHGQADLPRHTTDQAACKALVEYESPEPPPSGGGCSGQGPWIVRLGDKQIQPVWRLVVRLAGGKLLASEPFFDGYAGRCTYSSSITLNPAGKRFAHVVTSDEVSRYEWGRDMGGDVVPCKDNDSKCCAGDDDKCVSYCRDAGWERRDVVFDLQARQRVLLISQDGISKPPRPPVTVVVKGGVIKLSGGNCEREIRP